MEQLKAAYRTYRWVRVAVSAGLLISGILLYWLPGGFPPWAWRFAVAIVPRVPELWAVQGAAVLLPLIGLVLHSAALLLLWVLLTVATLKVATFWRQNVYEHHKFSHDLQEAELMAEHMVEKEREADIRLDQVVDAWQPQPMLFAAASASPQASAIGRSAQYVGNARDASPIEGDAGIRQTERRVESLRSIARARGGVGFMSPAEQAQAIGARSTTFLPAISPTAPAPQAAPVRPPVSARGELYIVPRPDEEVEDEDGYDTLPHVDRQEELDDIEQHPTVPDQDYAEEIAAPDPETPLRLAVGMGLDPGLVRKDSPNEDNLFAIQGMREGKAGQEPVGLFVVADGMGGHANGQVASRMAIQAVSDVVAPTLLQQEDADEAFDELLLESVHRANLSIYQRNREQENMMGTTMTAALVIGTTAHIVNVGDSRIYRYRPSEGLEQVTRDHSIVARLVEDGVITRDEIYTHPRRNQIYRCLGEKASVEVDPFTLSLQEGDILLLCSDGLWEMVRDPDIAKIVAASAPHTSQISSILIQAALSRGGADNISVIVVAVIPK